MASRRSLSLAEKSCCWAVKTLPMKQRVTDIMAARAKYSQPRPKDTSGLHKALNIPPNIKKKQPIT